MQGTTRTPAYTYDALGRLGQARVNGTLAADYDYDASGNRTALRTQSGVTTATVDIQDRLLTYGAASYVYSANGDLQRRILGADTTM